jgi:hypothetical protein
MRSGILIDLAELSERRLQGLGTKRVVFDATFAQGGLHWIVDTVYGPARSIRVGAPEIVHPVVVFASSDSEIMEMMRDPLQACGEPG